MSSAIATGAAPDLVLASQEELHTLSRFIAPIRFRRSPCVRSRIRLWKRKYPLSTEREGYYGIPFLVDPLVLFANRSILSSSGIAKPPATWEALIGLRTERRAPLTPTRQITRGLIALGTYDNVHSARAVLSSLFLQTNIPVSSYVSSGALVADLGGSDASGGAPPGRAVLGFYTQFADPSKVSYTWNASLPDSERMFLTGDLALYLGYVSARGTCDRRTRISISTLRHCRSLRPRR